MGVPAFFRWLQEKYPGTTKFCVEEKKHRIGTEVVNVDATQPNPNGVEFDNLYLDMNGIIHPCAHPENGPQPETEEEMFIGVTKYVERLFNAVRPRKVLYMAIDGCAPRAKMNQQRARRFCSARELDEIDEAEAEARAAFKKKGVVFSQKKRFDHNVITPGTPFMAKLSLFLRHFIHDKMTNDTAWSKIKVILSDASVPGEGEHKLMEFIRNQRAQPGFDPNTRHVLHGLDADLIMLGLATHEAHFYVLREEVIFNKATCNKCGKVGHKGHECPNANEKSLKDVNLNAPQGAEEQRLLFLKVAKLREYLEKEFEEMKTTIRFEFSIDRIIDDIIFLCFFVGNDFLPHLPSLDIREGALDMIINLYKIKLPSIGGYLTNSGIVHLARVGHVVAEIAEIEDMIFKKRQGREQHFERRRKQNEERRERELQFQKQREVQEAQKENMKQDDDDDENNEDYDDGMEPVRKKMKCDEDPEAGLKGEITGDSQVLKDELKKIMDDRAKAIDVSDNIQLGNEGWRERYYIDKFGDKGKDPKFIRQLVSDYVEGLCWVFHYYYRGVASWGWFFPFHFAPFASDLVNLEEIQIKFEPGRPFRPIDQLMGVLPARSAHCMPEKCQELMTMPASPIIDFYPLDFKMDPNGKKMKWLWVALLPFIDEERLRTAIAKIEPTFNDEEKARNMTGANLLFMNKATFEGTKFETDVKQPPASGRFNPLTIAPWPIANSSSIVNIENVLSLSGRIAADGRSPPIDGEFPSPLPGKLKTIKQNRVMSFQFYNAPRKPHSCKLLEGAAPVRELTDDEWTNRTRPRMSFFNIADLAYPEGREAFRQGRKYNRGGRGGRGRGGRGGYNNGRGGYNNNRGGYNQGNRGGYNNNRGGRGGYNNRQQHHQQGGYQQRDNYNQQHQQGGYQQQRQGYNQQRGGNGGYQRGYQGRQQSYQDTRSAPYQQQQQPRYQQQYQNQQYNRGAPSHFQQHAPSASNPPAAFSGITPPVGRSTPSAGGVPSFTGITPPVNQSQQPRRQWY
eukprot:TRINITY_DN522_c0_g1_i1.p1 TRINITY_DN522_c0_g1~~TRINITY_DN522_c0_g1_i1.p1  ORF type:complete len:1017 (+),score=410.54 TRINITY_DN522_c0_g1_i1:93-3143(+)